MTRTLVVGTGFLGKYVINELLSYPDNEVVAMDKQPANAFYSFPYFEQQGYKNDKRLKYLWKSAGDIAQIVKEIPDGINSFDNIVYTAAIADVPYALRNTMDTLNVNVVNTAAFMDYLRFQDYNGRLIMMSSESVYGHQPVEEIPLEEKEQRAFKKMKGIREDNAVLKPKDTYAWTKAAQEFCALSYFRSYGMKVTVLRSATMFGPYSRTEQVMPIFIKAALERRPITIDGDGSGSRDFNYVLNTVLAIKNIVMNEKIKGNIDGEIFNIGTGEETRLKALAMAIKTLTNSTSDLKFREWRAGEEGLRVCLDIKKAQDAIGYEPVVKTIDGIKNTIRWMAQDVLEFDLDEMEELDRTLGIIKKARKVGETTTMTQETVS